jgi:hypothetical protein
MATICHLPVRREDLCTHRDYPCDIGQHRSHAVLVGQWRLVHLTAPSTCHRVLARDQHGLRAAFISAPAPLAIAAPAHLADASRCTVGPGLSARINDQISIFAKTLSPQTAAQLGCLTQSSIPDQLWR